MKGLYYINEKIQECGFTVNPMKMCMLFDLISFSAKSEIEEIYRKYISINEYILNEIDYKKLFKFSEEVCKKLDTYNSILFTGYRILEKERVYKRILDLSERITNLNKSINNTLINIYMADNLEITHMTIIDCIHNEAIYLLNKLIDVYKEAVYEIK